MFYDLRQGDSTILFSAVRDSSIDAVVTDPPYFIDGMGNGWNKSGLEQSASKGKAVRGLPVGMKFDPRQGHDFEAFMKVVSDQCFRVLKPGGFFLSFSQPRLYHRMALAADRAGFEILDVLTWSRPGQAKAFSQDHFVRNKLKKGKISEEDAIALLRSLDGRKTPQLGSQSELVMLARRPPGPDAAPVAAKQNRALLNISESPWQGAAPSNIIRTGARRTGKDKSNTHMTVKPVDLVAHLVRLSTPKGGVVLDPFLGSGSHGVSTISEGRSFIGFEMVEDYFALSRARISEAADEFPDCADRAPGSVLDPA